MNRHRWPNQSTTDLVHIQYPQCFLFRLFDSIYYKVTELGVLDGALVLLVTAFKVTERLSVTLEAIQFS